MNNNEEIRKELYNNMIQKSKVSQKKVKLGFILEVTMKTFKIVTIIIIIIILIVCMYFLTDSMNFYIDIEKFIESDVGRITVVSQDTDNDGIGTYIFKLDKIPDIKIHAYKNYSTISDDGRARVYKYLFDKWNNTRKNKFIVEEYYIDSKFNDKTINNWILEYNTCINITNYSELMEAIDLVIEFAKYAEKNIDYYVYFPCSIQFNEEYINPYSKSRDEISDYVQKWYEEVAKEKVTT